MALPDWLDPPLKYGSAFIGGGFVGTWFGWFIEKRRARLARRQSLVDSWRSELLTDFDSSIYGGQPRYAFMSKPAYASLRPHLSPDFLKVIEGRRVTVPLHTNPLGTDPDWTRRKLMEEIGRIEREWRLV